MKTCKVIICEIVNNSLKRFNVFNEYEMTKNNDKFLDYDRNFTLQIMSVYCASLL